MGFIERLSRRIALYSVRTNPNSESVEMVTFAFQIFLNALLTVLIAAVTCLITGHFWDAALVFIILVPLRFMTGGSHLKSGMMCSILTALIFIGLAHVPHLSLLTIIVFNMISIYMFTWFAPKGVTHLFKLDERQIGKLKWIAVAVALLNCILLSPVVAATLLFQAIALTKSFDKFLALLDILGKEGTQNETSKQND